MKTVRLFTHWCHGQFGVNKLALYNQPFKPFMFQYGNFPPPIYLFYPISLLNQLKFMSRTGLIPRFQIKLSGVYDTPESAGMKNLKSKIHEIFLQSLEPPQKNCLARDSWVQKSLNRGKNHVENVVKQHC